MLKKHIGPRPVRRSSCWKPSPSVEASATIEITTRGFEHEFQEAFADRYPISDVFVADLDGNGFDEIYIIITSAGSGSYGTVMGFRFEQRQEPLHDPFP